MKRKIISVVLIAVTLLFVVLMFTGRAGAIAAAFVFGVFEFVSEGLIDDISGEEENDEDRKDIKEVPSGKMRDRKRKSA